MAKQKIFGMVYRVSVLRIFTQGIIAIAQTVILLSSQLDEAESLERADLI